MTRFFFLLLGVILALGALLLTVLEALDPYVTRWIHRVRGRRAAQREMAAQAMNRQVQ